MTKPGWILLLLVVTSLLAACRQLPPDLNCVDPLGCVHVAPGDPLTIAYMLTTSGDTAFLGEDARGGIEIALEERESRLLDHPIVLQGFDSGCNREEGQAAAESLVSDPTLLGIIGTSCSQSALAAVDLISEAGLLMISPSNTAPELTDAGEAWRPGYFRTVHNNLLQGRIAAEFAYHELGARTAATIYDRRPYAGELQQQFAATFQALGGTITFQGRLNQEDENLDTILTSIAADNTDALYFPLFEPEGNRVIVRAAELPGLAEIFLISADSLFVDSFPENTGPAAAGVYLTGPYLHGPAHNAFLARWVSRFEALPLTNFHAFAYDATNILLDAINQVAQIGEDSALVIGRQALRDAVAATNDYAGLSGRLSCSATGDCASNTAIGIYQITEAETNEGNWPPPVVWTPGR